MSKGKCIPGLCLISLPVLAQENEAFGSNAMLEDLRMQAGQGHCQIQGTTQGSLRPPVLGRMWTEVHNQTLRDVFCQKCCSECLCMPPGTYGNKNCPFYNNWKTRRGGPKCP